MKIFAAAMALAFALPAAAQTAPAGHDKHGHHAADSKQADAKKECPHHRKGHEGDGKAGSKGGHDGHGAHHGTTDPQPDKPKS